MADGLLYGRRELGGSSLVGEWVGLAFLLACVVDCKWPKLPVARDGQCSECPQTG
jgi:hypothetical protein